MRNHGKNISALLLVLMGALPVRAADSPALRSLERDFAKSRNLAALAVALGGVVIAGAALPLFDGDKAASSGPQNGSSKQTTAPVKPAATAKPADERFVIKRILPIKGAIKYGEWHWDEAGVPDGPMVITVDLDARVLSAWRGGYARASGFPPRTPRRLPG